MQAQKTKKHIFDVAHNMFRERGFNNVTVEEIADAAGISVGTLYHHFKNKFGILVEWHNRLDALYSAYYEKLSSNDGPSKLDTLGLIREMLLYMNEECIYYGTEYIGAVYSYMLTDDEFAKIMTDRNRAYYRILTALVREGQKNGTIRSDIAESQLVSDITVISRGCLTDWAIERAPDDMRSHTASVIDSFLLGIAANKND